MEEITGGKIKKLLRARGMTQEDLSKLLGISKAATNMRLKSPSLKTLQAVAAALNVPLNDLMTDATEPHDVVTICPHCGKPLKVTIAAVED